MQSGIIAAAAQRAAAQRESTVAAQRAAILRANAIAREQAEYNPHTGQVRACECYDHQGNVNRIKPK